MTAYRRNQVVWTCIMMVSLTMGLLALYVSTWFLVPFFGMVFVIPYVLAGIVCPKCGTAVTYQGTFFGVRVKGGFIRKQCQQCGWNLNTNYTHSK
jgi:hypothetical protein